MQSTSVIIKTETTKILISIIYKPAKEKLVTGDSGQYTVQTRLNNDYVVMASSTSIFYPYAQNQRPHVLDVALIKVSLLIQVKNLNESLDQNPILLEIHATPLTPTPPTSIIFFNWHKYLNILSEQKETFNEQINNMNDID